MSVTESVRVEAKERSETNEMPLVNEKRYLPSVQPLLALRLAFSKTHETQPSTYRSSHERPRTSAHDFVPRFFPLLEKPRFQRALRP